MEYQGTNLLPVLKIAVKAGLATLNHYGKPIDVITKADDSPLTQADLESNTIINSYLENTGIPVLSEENSIEDYTVRKEWTTLWIVDPLDGTKEFVNARKEYTINIAMVENGIPVFGVIYAPVLDLLYWGLKTEGAFMLNNASKLVQKESGLDKAQKFPVSTDNNILSVVASKSHLSNETREFLKKLEKQTDGIDLKSFGSSLKLCKIAEGTAHIYPRLAPTMEWDTAAGHAIVESSGNRILSYPNLETVVYNKKDLLNPWFIAYDPTYENLIRE